MEWQIICSNATVLTIIVLGLIKNSESVTFLSDNVKITKCCPQGNELIVVTDKSGQKSDDFQCSGTGQGGEVNQTFFGYNLEIKDKSQIPSCHDVLLFDIDVDGEAISSGFSYDIINRECVKSLDVSEDFHKLFSKAIGIFQTKVPNCESNEIFVEYETDIHNTKLMKNGLKLSAIESEILKSEKFCIDGIVNSKWNKTMARRDNGIIVRTCRPKVLCAGMPCVRRCCSNEMMMQRLNGSIKCVPYARNIKPTFYDIGSPTNGSSGYLVVEPTVYGLINTQTCNKYKLSNDPDDAHYISHVDGSVHVRNYEKPFSFDEYCVEFLDIGTVDLLNLHGKTLVCHLSSLLSAYVSLAIVQFHSDQKLEHCFFVAYLIFFSFLAAFCWQSIMCFDMWRTFGTIRTIRLMKRTKEMRTFLLYSLHGWGLPTILTLSAIFVDYFHLLPDSWSPQMGSKNMCWFARENWRGYFVFFFFPIALHILTNVILFILTAIHCNKIKSEINSMQCANDNELPDGKRKFLADKAKYTMNLKLFVVMGGTWSMKILATLLQWSELYCGMSRTS
ncbi:uncharacterized protein LOC119078616 [Bradysia coprophila]|uniref:uncharacterized protein LOC119078616 n=1 Tax=Bradysia coprophila TaxID=38358 RepID=UPI00187DB9D0|nr:uncharacterized protein LOC119078616 [Bradysia coprophila]